MYFFCTFLPAFLTITSLASPISPRKSGFTFTLSKFFAYVPERATPADQELRSWATFRLQPDPSSPVTIQCTAITPAYTPLLTSQNYYPCEEYREEQETWFGFVLPEGFREVTVIKTFRGNDGSYLKGWATQATDWTGANITHYSWGRGYTRDEAWEFEITSMVN